MINWDNTGDYCPQGCRIYRAPLVRDKDRVTCFPSVPVIWSDRSESKPETILDGKKCSRLTAVVLIVLSVLFASCAAQWLLQQPWWRR